MSDQRQNLFVGFGSPHGDDQAGWLVADRLAEEYCIPANISVRKAAIPLDLLDHLDGVENLYVCDAIHQAASSGEIRRWEWIAGTHNSRPAELFDEFRRLRCGGSHGFGLIETLDLASKLGRLPRCIVIWAVAGTRFAAGAPISENVQNNLPHVIDAILNEINHARNVPRAGVSTSS